MTVVELGEFNHFFTETLGYWMFGVYNIATVTVLLNMLIAMMSRSFEIIQVIFIYLFVIAKVQKMKLFERTIINIPSLFNLKMCFGCSKEPSQ